jgi:hypothetical protein
MDQISFMESSEPVEFGLDSGLKLQFDHENRTASLFKGSVHIKAVDLDDKTGTRIFLVEAMELGANQSYLAKAFKISRQTLHNYRECKKHFGLEGLIHNYGTKKKRRKEARAENADKLSSGSTCDQLRELRKQQREVSNPDQLSFDFENPPTKINSEFQVFQETHDWKATRYAGTAIYQPVLFKVWRWLELVQGHFGNHFRIFLVFLLMSARNIRSMEQLKHVRKEEAACVLGMEEFPHKKLAGKWCYLASAKRQAGNLLHDFFQYQIRSGLVKVWTLFTDGHLLPYTGKARVHYSFSTQKKQPVPGRTNMVTCDIDGRIVDMDIQEGKGDLRRQIIDMSEKWKSDIPYGAVHVFDREGTGVKFFYEMVDKNIEFVTWEKNANKQQLDKIKDSLFNQRFIKNGKQYSVFEDTKKFEFKREGKKEVHRFSLRRIYLWNHSSNRRALGLSWSDASKMTIEDCALAILSRWGASENAFKHIQERHPFHYHPGFKKAESNNQEIANPEVKEKKSLIAKLNREIGRFRIELSKTKEAKNKDGVLRKNNKHTKLKKQIEQSEYELAVAREEAKHLPERIDISGLENYDSFKEIDNEGKYLFDFATSSIWNARKWMVDVLKPFYQNDDEVVDLFYAISHCHGWIKVTDKQVLVRLEPLQQPKRLMAQDYLCKKLTSLGAQTPGGKRMIYEVGMSSQKT